MKKKGEYLGEMQKFKADERCNFFSEDIRYNKKLKINPSTYKIRGKNSVPRLKHWKYDDNAAINLKFYVSIREHSLHIIRCVLFCTLNRYI